MYGLYMHWTPSTFACKCGDTSYIYGIQFDSTIGNIELNEELYRGTCTISFLPNQHEQLFSFGEVELGTNISTL